MKIKAVHSIKGVSKSLNNLLIDGTQLHLKIKKHFYKNVIFGKRVDRGWLSTQFLLAGLAGSGLAAMLL